MHGISHLPIYFNVLHVQPTANRSQGTTPERSSNASTFPRTFHASPFSREATLPLHQINETSFQRSNSIPQDVCEHDSIVEATGLAPVHPPPGLTRNGYSLPRALSRLGDYLSPPHQTTTAWNKKQTTRTISRFHPSSRVLSGVSKRTPRPGSSGPDDYNDVPEKFHREKTKHKAFTAETEDDHLPSLIPAQQDPPQRDFDKYNR